MEVDGSWWFKWFSSCWFSGVTGDFVLSWWFANSATSRKQSHQTGSAPSLTIAWLMISDIWFDPCGIPMKWVPKKCVPMKLVNSFNLNSTMTQFAITKLEVIVQKAPILQPWWKKHHRGSNRKNPEMKIFSQWDFPETYFHHHLWSFSFWPKRVARNCRLAIYQGPDFFSVDRWHRGFSWSR